MVSCCPSITLLHLNLMFVDSSPQFNLLLGSNVVIRLVVLLLFNVHCLNARGNSFW